MEEFDALDEQFKSTLGDLKVTPPEAVWENVSSSVIAKKKKRRAIIWLFSGGITLLASIGLFFFSGQKTTLLNPKNQIAPTPIVKNTVSKTNKKIERSASKKNAQIINSKPEKAPSIVPPSEILSDPKSVVSTASNPAKTTNEVPRQAHVHTNTTPSNQLSNNTSKRASTFNAQNEDWSVHQNVKNKLPTLTQILINQLPVQFQSEQLESSITPKEPTYVQEHNQILRLSPAFIGVNYSPIFSPQNIISASAIPLKNLIVQKNLVNQKIVDFSGSNNYSHQFGVYAGIHLNKRLAVIGGLEYAHWNGQANLYLDNTYEHQTTYTKEVITQETIVEIVEQTTQGKAKNINDVTRIITNREKTNPLGGGFGEHHIPVGGVTTNPPVDREITRTEATITTTQTKVHYEKVTLIENITYNDTVTTTFNYRYLELPIQLRYSFGEKKLKGFVSAGVSTLIGQRLSLDAVTISQRGQTYQQQQTYPSVRQWNGLLSCGMMYRIIPNIDIQLAPMAKWNLSDDSINPNRKAIYHIQLGVSYNF